MYCSIILDSIRQWLAIIWSKQDFIPVVICENLRKWKSYIIPRNGWARWLDQYVSLFKKEAAIIMLAYLNLAFVELSQLPSKSFSSAHCLRSLLLALHSVQIIFKWIRTSWPWLSYQCAGSSAPSSRGCCRGSEERNAFRICKWLSTDDHNLKQDHSSNQDWSSWYSHL